MTNEKSIADIYGRAVHFLELGSSDPSSPSFSVSSSSSLVLLYVGSQLINSESVETLFSQLISHRPLAATVAEKSANAYFDGLLEVQSRLDFDARAMTYFIGDDNPNKIVQIFLNSSFPDDERFDDWKEYAVLSFERETLLREGLLRATATIAETH